MLKIRYTSKFKKDYKAMLKRGSNSKKLEDIIGLLAEEKELSVKNNDHALAGNYMGFRECHI